MSPEPHREPPVEARRLDPRRALEQDPLAASLMATQGHEPALAHMRARDPRARLDLAAQALHGRTAELPNEEPQADAPRRRLL